MSPNYKERCRMSNSNPWAAIRGLQEENSKMANVLSEIQGYMKAMGNTPKWIEEIPGSRTPYFAVIEVTISANSTSRSEGTHTVSTDGPFVCTGVFMTYQRTSGAYSGIWGPATAFGSKITTSSQQHGFAYLFDQPNCASFTIEIIDKGSERLWQSKPVSSALYAPQAGGAYILPASHLFKRNSVILFQVTPDVSVPQAGKIQAIFLGYKIVQGIVYQP